MKNYSSVSNFIANCLLHSDENRYHPTDRLHYTQTNLTPPNRVPIIPFSRQFFATRSSLAWQQDEDLNFIHYILHSFESTDQSPNFLSMYFIENLGSFEKATN